MKKFNKQIETGCTYVQINNQWYLVRNINDSRTLISVYGLVGSFQRNHIEKYTNRYVGSNK